MKEVVFEGVEAMPVDEEVDAQGEQQGQSEAQEEAPPDLGEDSVEEQVQGEDDLTCQECAPKRTLPDPGQPTQQQLEDHRVDQLPLGRGAQNV